MDMYVRMCDEMMFPQGHNPTIGLILCADTDDNVAFEKLSKFVFEIRCYSKKN